MTTPTISIALCTCNGDRFLKAFLDSLADQSAPPHELVIGDDASDDNTLKVIAQFAKTAPFTVRVIKRTARLGHTANFLETAKECDGDWIAFADQDDVWFKTKLAEVQSVIAENPDVLLVNQRALLCDEMLQPRDTNPFPAEDQPGLHENPHRPLPLVWPGFLMTVKAGLLRENEYPAADFDNAKMGHGRWAFLLASTLGSYFITKDPCAYYRRHGDALTGDYKRQKQSTSNFRERSLTDIQSRQIFAAHAAECLAQLTTGTAEPVTHDRMNAAASSYAKAASALSARAACYTSNSWLDRIGSVFRAASAGAYLGPMLYSGGAKAFLKDALAAISIRTV